MKVAVTFTTAELGFFKLNPGRDPAPVVPIPSDFQGHPGDAANAVIGREGLLPALNRFVADGGAERCLVLVGEAGIGKTTVWEMGLEVARAPPPSVGRGRLRRGWSRRGDGRLRSAGGGHDGDRRPHLG